MKLHLFFLKNQFNDITFSFPVYKHPRNKTGIEKSLKELLVLYKSNFSLRIFTSEKGVLDLFSRGL